MRLVFAGTAEFALPALAAVAAQHEPVRVLTQPDRPAGRGRHLHPSPVRARAEALGLDVAMPERLDAAAIAELRTLAPEVLVVVAYGLLIPPALLALPRYGGLNIHPSLLPRWRGAAPVERAIEAGDRETGVAVMRLAAGLDTGPVYRMDRTPIGADETAGELSTRLADRGAGLLLEVLDALAAGSVEPVPQKGPASHAARFSSAEAKLDFSQSASVLARRVRAFCPRPVAWAECAGERIRIHRAQAVMAAAGSVAPPGSVIDVDEGGINVACGEGILRLRVWQRPGRKPLTAAEHLRARDWRGLHFD